MVNLITTTTLYAPNAIPDGILLVEKTGLRDGEGMTYYNICTDRNLYHLQDDPAFWKALKTGDVVCGREVNSTAQTMTCCGWPLLDDLMTDEGTNWMVCRCWEEEGDDDEWGEE